MAYVISFANEKGGVAKTTSAVSLAGTLVELGNRVLLIDLDAQCNLSMAAGIEPGLTQTSIAKVLLGDADLPSSWQAGNQFGLSIVPASQEMTIVERMLPGRSGYENVLEKAIHNRAVDFNYVIIDCPPFLGAVTLNALVASNLLIMPTQAEYFSISALRDMMSLIRRIRTQYNPHLTYRLLLTLFDRRNRIHRTMSQQLRDSFGVGVLETVIEIDTKVRESSLAGVPINYHAPKSRAALQYRALAQEMIQHVQKTTAQPA